MFKQFLAFIGYIALTVAFIALLFAVMIIQPL